METTKKMLVLEEADGKMVIDELSKRFVHSSIVDIIDFLKGKFIDVNFKEDEPVVPENVEPVVETPKE